MHKVYGAALSLALLLAPVAALAQASTGDRLLKVNEDFRSDYARAKKEQLDKVGPVLVLANDVLYLCRRSDRAEFQYNTRAFTLLKTVSHMPLAVFTILHGHTGEISPERATSLKTLAALMEKSRTEIESADLADSIKKRQLSVCEQTLTFINKVTAAGSIKSDELENFTGSMAGPVLDAVYDAVGSNISELDRQVRKCKDLMPASDWSKVHVVVCGNHMPRDRAWLMQYFSRVLEEPTEGRRLIYAEGVDDTDKALDLLATHLMDADIAVAFFGDYWRMHRDLLSDAASRYMDEHHTTR